MTVNCYVGPFTYEHNNPPAPFNPEFDDSAHDWAILATYDTLMAGMYDNGATREEIADYRLKAYCTRKSKGTPNKAEVEKAKSALYERG